MDEFISEDLFNVGKDYKVEFEKYKVIVDKIHKNISKENYEIKITMKVELI